MRPYLTQPSLLLFLSSFVLFGCNNNDQSTVTPSAKETAVSQSKPTPPIAAKQPHSMTIHGDTRVDNYYWMRDDQRSDPKILAHLEAENTYAQQSLAHTQDLQDTLFEEINSRVKKDDSSVPQLYRGYYYYRRYEGDQEYPVYVRKKTLEGEEQVLLDGNAMAKDQDYFSIGSSSVSPNSQLLAYSTDTVGRRIYTLQFKDLSTDQLLADKIENASSSIVWANDNKTVFYIKKDAQTLLGYQVYRHELGTPQSQDTLVFEETDRSFYTGIGKTKDDSYLLIYHSSTTSQGVSLLNADTPTDKFNLFHPIEADHEYSIEKLGDDFYVMTNWEATNFRLMKTSLANAKDKSKWQDVIAHREQVLLTDFELFNDYLVVNETERGQNRIVYRNWQQQTMTALEFDDPVFVAGMTGNVTTDTNKVRVYYSSLTTPLSYYDYDLKSKQRQLLKQDEILGDFDPKNYGSERIFIAARDGVEVPVSIVYRKDKFKQDGSNPIYQSGYGSYGASRQPFFSSSRLSLLDRGFVYAIAHIRGGQELGRQWYEDGKLFNKKNTFTDFIDVTSALVKQKYGAEDKVFAVGGSAGGLLIGAVVNMEPSLYAGVAAHVPFVDVVTTMLDESIPLTTNEYDEWGNPNQKEYYDYMLSYSPYDNVSAQNYPHMLVTTGLHDSQVQYFEPMKWVAKLREYKTDGNTLVFKTEMEAGHSGQSGRFRRNKETALEFAFFMDLANIQE